MYQWRDHRLRSLRPSFNPYEAVAEAREQLPIQAVSRGIAEAVETPREEAVREMLDTVSNSQGRKFTATGEGEDVRIEEAGLSAAALVAKGRLIHLCGFRVKASLNDWMS